MTHPPHALATFDCALAAGVAAAIAAALVSLGRRKDGVPRYERVLAADTYFLLVRDTADDSAAPTTIGPGLAGSQPGMR